MNFIYGKDFILTIEEPSAFLGILNKQYRHSQLGRFPISEPKDNDDSNLILGIVVTVGAKDRKVIGRVSLENIDYINRTAELKIFILDEFKSKGYGKSACELIINHGFNQLGLNRIYAGTLETNIGFQKLATSLGFEQEGIRKSAVFKDGNFVDVIEYGLVNKKNDVI